ncbi:hypothetical protein D3C83_196950 [compost metagenome]
MAASPSAFSVVAASKPRSFATAAAAPKVPSTGVATHPSRIACGQINRPALAQTSKPAT